MNARARIAAIFGHFGPARDRTRAAATVPVPSTGSDAPSAHRRRLVLLGLSLALLGVVTTTAFAARVHRPLSDFGSFSTPTGVAVDQSNGDIFTAALGGGATSTGSIEKYGTDQNPANFSALSTNVLDGNDGGTAQADAIPVLNGFSFGDPADVAIDSDNDLIYVSDPNHNLVEVFQRSGAYVRQIDAAGAPAAFSYPVGVAVDSDGTVYVSDYNNSVVDIFDDTGAYLTQIASELNGPMGIAVDSTGVVYVRNANEGTAKALTPDAFPVTATTTYSAATVDSSGSVSDVAVDPADDHLYVANGDHATEYDSAAAGSGQLSSFGSGGAICYSDGIAAGGPDHKIYVSDQCTGGIHVFGAAEETPDVAVDPITVFDARTAHLSGTVDPAPDAAPGVTATFHFEYATHADFSDAQSTPDDTASGTGPQPVSADITSLQPNKAYYVRLVASNPSGSATSDPPVQVTTLPAAPDATTGASVLTNAGATARLTGQVNPNNSPTTYWFEYGTVDCSVGPCTSVPAAQNADAGSSFGPVAVQRFVAVAPATTYHFRLVAHNGAGTTAGDDQAFTTLPSVSSGDTEPLPDGRHYEMVSPPDKNGGDIRLDTFRVHVASDGNAMTFTSLTPFGDTAGAQVNTEFMAIRSNDATPGDNGWSTHGLFPPQEPQSQPHTAGSESHYADLSPDLRHGAFRAFHPLTDDPYVADQQNLYVRDDLRTPGVGTYRLVSSCSLCAGAGTALPPPPFGTSYAPYFSGASDDFRYGIFESSLKLTDDAGDPGPYVYEWTPDGTKLGSLVPPVGENSCGGTGPDCVAAPAAAAGGGSGIINAGGANFDQNTVSDDGSKFFFTGLTDQDNSSPVSGHIYVRTDGLVTDDASASERTDCAGDPTCGGDGIADPSPDPNGGPGAKWAGAAADGSRVFLTSGSALTDEVSPTSGLVLYSYDTTKPASDPHNLKAVFAESGANSLALSDDGRTLYLTLNSVNATQGLGIYRWHEGDGINFVAPLSGVQDARNAQSQFSDRVTPDGNSFVFRTVSPAPLPDGQPAGTCAPDPVAPGCAEIYVYRAGEDSLACVSCPLDGRPPTADAYNGFTSSGAGHQGGHFNRAVSDDGRYVFFSTAESLVPADTNGKVDAYEYDSSTGERHLLSSGKDPRDSWFVDAAPDGHDVFIHTRQRLVGWDRDSNADIYDVRVGGGFPEPPPGGTPCEGSDCLGDPDPPPADQSPGSGTFAGPGNQGRDRGGSKGRHGKNACRKKANRHKPKCRKPKNRSAAGAQKSNAGPTGRNR